jgi:hypothetical protein
MVSFVLFECKLQKAISHRHNSIFYAKINDHGTAGAIQDKYSPAGGVQWHLGPLGTVPTDIRMAIEMASEVGAFFSVIVFMSCINVVK